MNKALGSNQGQNNNMPGGTNGQQNNLAQMLSNFIKSNGN